MFWLRQNWACESCLSHSEKNCSEEDSGRGTYKIGYNEAQSDTKEDEEVEWISGNIHALRKDKEKPMKTTLTVQGQPLEMGIDMGASVSIVSKTTWKSVWKKGNAPLKDAKKTLKKFWGTCTCMWKVGSVGRHFGWTLIVSSACCSGRLWPEFIRKRLDSTSTN